MTNPVTFRWFGHTVAFLLGCGVGSVLVLETADRTADTPAVRLPVPSYSTIGEPEPTRSGAEHRPAPPAPDCCQDADQLRAELLVERMAATFTVASAVGVSIPWPDEVEPTYRRPAIERLVRETCASTVGKHVLVDCTEFPCVLIVPEHQRVVSCPSWDVDVAQAGFSYHHGRPYTSVAIAPNDWEWDDRENLDLRIRYRVAALLAQTDETWWP